MCVSLPDVRTLQAFTRAVHFRFQLWLELWLVEQKNIQVWPGEVRPGQQIRASLLLCHRLWVTSASELLSHQSDKFSSKAMWVSQVDRQTCTSESWKTSNAGTIRSADVSFRKKKTRHFLFWNTSGCSSYLNRSRFHHLLW